MKNLKKSKILLIKNLPSALTHEERSSFLSCFGASDVRVMPDGGHMKLTAFATFPDCAHAAVALDRLHQIELLGSVLTAEYTSNIMKHSEAAVPVLDCINDTNKLNKENSHENTEASKRGCKCSRKLPIISSSFGLNYSSNPSSKYLYPEPNSDILLNICGALLTVPKFYNQVLHLMNKMNLYAPFSPNKFIPPILLEHFCNVMNVPRHTLGGIPHAGTLPAPPLSSEESELEEDEAVVYNHDIPPPERALKVRKRKINLSNSPKRKLARIKLDTSASTDLKPSSQKTTISQMFEGHKPEAVKPHISLSVPQSINSKTSHIDDISVVTSHDNDQSRRKSEENVQGFGKINPLDKPQNVQESMQSKDYVVTKDFISEQQLVAGKLSSKEMSSHPLFKNHNPGPPSCRLYVKNVSKRASEKDVQHIFGCFVNFNDEEEAKMFDVRLMTQGRMKGQAFVGLPSIEVAIKAVRLTNGYQLIDKPLIVSFARSAKPKDVTS